MKIELWKVLLFFGLILALACKIYPNHLEMAALFEKSSMYYMAIDEVERALSRQVDLPVLNQAAKLYEVVGKAEKSIYYYDEIIARNPKDLDAHINLVRLYQWNRKPDSLVKEYERFVSRFVSTSEISPTELPYRNEALTNLHNLYSARGNWPKLIDLLELICELGLETEQTYIDLMDLYVRKRKADMAISTCRKARDKYPDSKRILEKSAWTTYLAGDLETATSSYYKLVFLYYDYRESWLNMISFLKTTKQTARLAEIYDDMLHIFSHDQDTCEWLAHSFFAIGVYDKAIELYTGLLADNPDNRRLKLALADAYEQSERYDKALEIFIALQNNVHFDRQIEENIITLLFHLKDYDQAQQRADALIASDLNDHRLILRMADLYEWNSLPSQAAESLEKALKHRPDDLDIVKRTARLYQWANNQHKAIEYFSKLTTAYPDQIEYGKSLISAYQSLSETDKARDIGIALLELHPDDTELLRIMSYFYMDSNDTAKAYEMLLRYKEFQEPDVEIVRNLAWLSQATGNKHESIGYYEKLITETEPNIAWVRELGRLYLETKQTDKAQMLIEQYSLLPDEDMQLQLLLADIYADTKQYDRAVDVIEPIIGKTDAQTRVTLIRQLAYLYIMQEEYRKAIDYLTEIHRENQTDMGIVEQLAYAYNNLGQPAQALHYFNTFLESDPDNIQAHYSAGYINLQLKKDRQARTHFVKAIIALNRQPQSTENYAMYARLYHQLRQYDHAIYWYTLAIRNAPDDANLYSEYLGMLLELELYDHIITMFSKAPEEIRETTSARYYLALAYAGTKQYDSAVELMEQIIAQNPDNGDYNADLAFIFQKKGRWDKSIQLYDDLLKRQPPSWSRYGEIENERKSIKKQYAPKLTAGFLLIDEIKKDTQVYYSNFQMYLLHNLLLRTGVSRYYFHDASLSNIPNVDDRLTEYSMELEYFFDRHWSLAVGPLVINNSTKDVYSFSMGLLYNNFENLSMSVRYSFRDKIIDPRVAVPLGGTSDHVDLKLEWQAAPYIRFMAEGVHGEYNFSSAVRRMGLSTSPGYYNRMVAGADLTLLYDPRISLTYRYYWSDSHMDRDYNPLFNISTKNRSHQFGIRCEQQISNNIFVYGTGFVANDDERDMFLSRMGQYGIEFGLRYDVTDSIELGGSYTFFSEKGIDSQPGRASYVNIFSSIAF